MLGCVCSSFFGELVIEAICVYRRDIKTATSK
jgi:hypothetical protein